MIKLIVDTELEGIPESCVACDETAFPCFECNLPVFYVRGATQVYSKYSKRRHPECPLVEVPEYEQGRRYHAD